MLQMKLTGNKTGNTDVAVPLSRLADIVEASKAEAEALGLNACVKGHVGDSNFHENITYDKSNPEEAAKVKLAVKNMVKTALEMEGTCTGEHGVGFGKKEALALEVGQDTIAVMVSETLQAKVSTNLSLETTERHTRSVLDHVSNLRKILLNLY